MPGVLFIYGLVAAAILIAGLVGRWYTRTARNQNPRDDFRRLQRHAAWLEERLDQARRERWEPAMISDLSDQLGKACGQLRRSRGSAAGPRPVRRH